MSSAISELKPAIVWKYFAEVSKIPRGSGNEAGIAEYVLKTAESLGLTGKRDDEGNVVVCIPASPGRESVPTVCLQGHLDMVCEANANTPHDFMKDPIELVRHDNVMMANGTTLGADNGIAIATGLALMEDRSLEHGPVELLFTVAEEVGLNGARALQPDFVTAKTLINLDSEEEGALYVGCSGGCDCVGVWDVEYKNAPAKSLMAHFSVKGLKGGHSGLDIHKGRGNALKIANRMIRSLEIFDVRLASFNGGNKRNAIPREAEVVFFFPKILEEAVKSLFEEQRAEILAEYASVEPDLDLTLEIRGKMKKGRVLKRVHQYFLTRTLTVMPHGVIKMSPDIPGLVETSTNLASIVMDRKTVVVGTSQRSSVASELGDMTEMVATAFELGIARVDRGEPYPGWKPNLESPILNHAKKVYEELYGRAPEVKAIHAGLECGIIGERYAGMDMVSFGPTLEGVHSPDEKIFIDTVEKFWDFLLAILKKM